MNRGLQLIRMAAGARREEPVAAGFSYLQMTQEDANLSTYTFSGVNIGEATAARVVICSCSFRSGTDTISVTSATIGGVAATVQQTVNLGTMVTIFWATVPTGASADVVVNLSAGAVRGVLYTYATTFGVVMVAASASAPGGNQTTLSIEPGFAVGHIHSHFTSAETVYTWTGLDEDGMLFQENNSTSASASREFTESIADHFVQAAGGSAGPRLLVVSFKPS